MSKNMLRPIFTPDILQGVTDTVQLQDPDVDRAEELFGQKIHALQRFLHHGMSRFSVETLQHVLFFLMESDLDGIDTQVTIRSLREVRASVKRVVKRQDAGIFRTSDADALKYMEMYFYCVYCMSEAKRLLGLVYQDLYYSYYNPDELSRQATNVISNVPLNPASSKRRDSLSVPEHYSQFGIVTLEQMTGSSRHYKLKQTVESMKTVLDRWADLLTDDVPNPQSFDPESEEDLARLHGTSGIETVLRLVPDMFCKHYKCLELAKQWWEIAHEIYPDLPFNRRPSVLSTKEQQDSPGYMSSASSRELIQENANEILLQENESNEDNESNEVIRALRKEIKILEKREENFEKLVETYNKVCKEIEHLQSKHQTLILDHESAISKGLPPEIYKIEAHINKNESDVRLLEFKQTLLFDDYVIHLKLKPTIILFLHNAKTHLEEALKYFALTERRDSDLEQSVDLNQFHLGLCDGSPLCDDQFSLQSFGRGGQSISASKNIESEHEPKAIRDKTPHLKTNQSRKQLLRQTNRKVSLSSQDVSCADEDGSIPILNETLITKSRKLQDINKKAHRLENSENNSEEISSKTSDPNRVSNSNNLKEIKSRTVNSHSNSRKSESNDNNRECEKQTTKKIHAAPKLKFGKVDYEKSQRKNNEELSQTTNPVGVSNSNGLKVMKSKTNNLHSGSMNIESNNKEGEKHTAKKLHIAPTEKSLRKNSEELTKTAQSVGISNPNRLKVVKTSPDTQTKSLDIESEKHSTKIRVAPADKSGKLNHEKSQRRNSEEISKTAKSVKAVKPRTDNPQTKSLEIESNKRESEKSTTKKTHASHVKNHLLVERKEKDTLSSKSK